jgi:cell division protein FtsI (penicillin-binding protein 3)
MGRSSYAARIIIIALGLILAFIYIIIHLYNVQIVQHSILYPKAKKKYTAVKKNHGMRGQIYDKNGHLLVGNIPSINIRANPQLVGEKDKCRELAGFFARKLNIDPTIIFRRLATKTRKGRKICEVVIKNLVPLDEAEKIKEEVYDRKFKGIYFYDSVKRYYPKNELLANVLGFINMDQLKVVPVSGIEKAYNSLLSPIKTKASIFERSRKGIPLTYGYNKLAEGKSGKDIYLTISEPIQEIVEEELDKIMEQWKPKAAYAVMVNPKTGSILAMAQRPTFDPNNRLNMHPDAWRNRIVTDGLEPGSTMKPLVICKALDLGLVKPDTKFFCENGYWFYGGWPLRDTHSYSDIDVTTIVQKSSNIGTAKIALEMGEQRLYHLLRQYGFGQQTNIPFQPEATGILRKLKNWDKLSITRFPIGHGVLASPLQLIGAYTALANKGERMNLRIVDQIVDTETEDVYKYPVRSAGQIIENKWAVKQIIDMMKLATKQGGTAWRGSIPNYEVAGKTGTAQKWINGAYSHSKHFASFIGFVPADNPAFVLLVVVDEPRGSCYGGVVGGPAFRDISLKTLRYLDIPETKPTE